MMSGRFLLGIAVLFILTIGSLGQDPLPPNLVFTDTFKSSSTYSTVTKIQTRVVPASAKLGTFTICVGIQYQGTKFDLYKGSLSGGLLSMSLLGSVNSNVQDFAILDRGTSSCEHVALLQSGAFTSDFGDIVSLALPNSPKKIAYSVKDYSNLGTQRMLFYTNGTGFTAYNVGIGDAEWTYNDPNTINTVNVANYGLDAFAIILGIEAGVGPSISATKLRGSPYSYDSSTTFGARGPYYTAISDGTRVFCYDNGANIATTGAVYCGTSALEVSDIKVASSAIYTSVQVSPVQNNVVTMTAAMASTITRFKLLTLNTVDLTVVDSWNGPPILATPPFVVSSHSSNNVIAVTYLDTVGFINVTVFNYGYVAPLPPVGGIPTPPPTTPSTVPTLAPFVQPPTVQPPTTISPLATPSDVPLATPQGGNGPVGTQTPGTTSTPSSSPARVPGTVTPSPSNGTNPTDNVGGNNPTGLTPDQIGLIVGLTVGGAVLATGVFLLVFLLRKKQQKKKDKPTDEVPMTAAGGDEPGTYGNIPGMAPGNKYGAMASIAPASDEGIVPTNIQPGEIDKRLHIPHRSLVFVKEIGAGSYGKVYLGEWRGAKVAIKVNNTITDVDGFLAEAKLTLGIPPHPNLVQTFGVSLDGPNPCIVLEYCGGGSLDQLFTSENGLTNEKRVEYALKIAYGLAHLHSRSIVHRDLAARNILLTNDGTPKISDFGMSRIVQEEAAKGRTKTNVGPIRWMAPESLQDRSYSLKTDVWTYGIMLFEMVTGKEPHEEEDQFEIALKIRDKGYTPQIPDDCDPTMRECMEMCWKKLPADRPDMEEICDFLRSKTGVEE